MGRVVLPGQHSPSLLLRAAAGAGRRRLCPIRSRSGGGSVCTPPNVTPPPPTVTHPEPRRTHVCVFILDVNTGISRATFGLSGAGRACSSCRLRRSCISAEISYLAPAFHASLLILQSGLRFDPCRASAHCRRCKHALPGLSKRGFTPPRRVNTARLSAPACHIPSVTLALTLRSSWVVEALRRGRSAEQSRTAESQATGGSPGFTGARGPGRMDWFSRHCWHRQRRRWWWGSSATDSTCQRRAGGGGDETSGDVMGAGWVGSSR